jgi:redox-sensitive bicupin YhaK (pirin superfamily)
MADSVLQKFSLGSQWPTVDPFLFVAYHNDEYPASDGALAPGVPLTGRQLGNDFSGRDGWSMYHGKEVPGFPQHPHRGFETITYVRCGYIDHADSLGATARFGEGDTQWMTAGSGIQHCEMFPLLNDDAPNPLELFQIWLNLPARDKMVDPYFTMLWSHLTPTEVIRGANGEGSVSLTVVAGRIRDLEPATPPPDSWASRDGADVAIWHLSMEPDTRFELPVAAEGSTRALYAFEGSTVAIGATEIAAGTGALIRSDEVVELSAGPEGIEIMILQGRLIGEPVAQHGPFVMNTQNEIQDAFRDYQATQFGGWPWPNETPNHGAEARRFAIHADGRREDIP